MCGLSRRVPFAIVTSRALVGLWARWSDPKTCRYPFGNLAATISRSPLLSFKLDCPDQAIASGGPRERQRCPNRGPSAKALHGAACKGCRDNGRQEHEINEAQTLRACAPIQSRFRITSIEAACGQHCLWDWPLVESGARSCRISQFAMPANATTEPSPALTSNGRSHEASISVPIKSVAHEWHCAQKQNASISRTFAHSELTGHRLLSCYALISDSCPSKVAIHDPNPSRTISATDGSLCWSD